MVEVRRIRLAILTPSFRYEFAIVARSVLSPAELEPDRLEPSTPAVCMPSGAEFFIREFLGSRAAASDSRRSVALASNRRAPGDRASGTMALRGRSSRR
jgi:hypothetical protein